VDLIELADRRLSKGPFHFEKGGPDSRPLLAVVATAIGQFGPEFERRHEVSDALLRIATSAESEVRSAALAALKRVEAADRSRNPIPNRARLRLFRLCPVRLSQSAEAD
jgi:hypothetical protein